MRFSKEEVTTFQMRAFLNLLQRRLSSTLPKMINCMSSFRIADTVSKSFSSSFQFDQVFDSAVTSNTALSPELIRAFTVDFLEGKSCTVVSVDAGAAGSHNWLLGSDLTFASWTSYEEHRMSHDGLPSGF